MTLEKQVLDRLIDASRRDLWLSDGQIFSSLKDASDWRARPELFKIAEKLAAKGVIDLRPINREGRMVAFTARLSLQGSEKYLGGSLSGI